MPLSITLNAPFLYQQHLSSLLHSIPSFASFFLVSFFDYDEQPLYVAQEIINLSSPLSALSCFAIFHSGFLVFFCPRLFLSSLFFDTIQDPWPLRVRLLSAIRLRMEWVAFTLYVCALRACIHKAFSTLRYYLANMSFVINFACDIISPRSSYCTWLPVLATHSY